MIIKTSARVGLIIIAMLLAAFFVSFPAEQPKKSEINSSSIEEDEITVAKRVNQQTYDQAGSLNASQNHKSKPSSIADINHDVVLKTDADGNLIVGEEAKHLFEFYLSSIGEESLEQILTRIQYELDEQLQPPALDQALSLLKRYVDYKIELAELEAETNVPAVSSLSDLEKIKLQKSQLNTLRTQYFDQTEHQQFFEQEEAYDSYMLSHLEIMKNGNLDEAEKKQQAKLLEQTLPEEIQLVRKQVTKHSNLYETAINMRKTGASEEEIYQVRAQTLGDDAAVAMAKLDNDRKQWQQRLTNYAQHRDQIINSGLSNEDSALAINELIENNFSGTERLRVKALNSTL